MALTEAEHSFDIVRSERTLQWVDDPEVAVAEMSRVLRPGGRVSLIDTDWSTFHITVDSSEVSDKVRNAMRVERNRPSNVGNRLAQLLTTAGLDVVAETAATQTWTDWNPDASPAPDGASRRKDSLRTLLMQVSSTTLTPPASLQQSSGLGSAQLVDDLAVELPARPRCVTVRNEGRNVS